MIKSEHHPQFFTATILEWKHLLKEDKYKDLLLQSLNFLVKEKRVVVNSFVLMSNHIHLIWQIMPGNTPEKVQLSFMKFTAQQIKFDLMNNNPTLLQEFKVGAKDRAYQFWERNSLSIELHADKVFNQKLEYIHWNPVKAGLCQYPEDYHYSSARFHLTRVDDFDMLHIE